MSEDKQDEAELIRLVDEADIAWLQSLMLEPVMPSEKLEVILRKYQEALK